MTLVRTGNSGAVVYVQGVPGATGATGRPGVDAQAVPASTSVTALLAAQLDPANAGKVRSAQNLATRRFAGTFQDSGAAGSSPVVKHRGLNPLNLGAGLATAVGCKADGTPCRATDPLCVSAINFLGWCDEGGNFFDDPWVASAWDVRDFGAIPNDPTSDLALAIRTILDRMPALGGEIRIPNGQWYLLSSEPSLPGVHVLVDKAIQLVGSNGFSPFDYNCRIIAQPGRSAFRFAYGSGNSLVTRLGFSWLSQLNTTSTVASYTPSVPALITVSDGHDFEVGQFVGMCGAAKALPLTSTTGSVTIGTKTVTLVASVFGTLPGIRAGDWIKLGAAYTSPALVQSISENGLTLTMRDNAAATVTNAQVYLCPEMYFRVTAVDGNTLTVDNHNTDGESLVGATLFHGDTAIDQQSVLRIESVSIGGYSIAESAKGPAVAWLADHGFTPISNANCSSITGLFVCGARHAIFAYGVDAHRSDVVGLKFIANNSVSAVTSWAILDLSGYGSDYYTVHFDGGKGILTADSPNHQSAFYGAYSEGGSAYYFGRGTTLYGGTLDQYVGGRMSNAKVETGFSLSRRGARHRTDFDPSLDYAQYFNTENTVGGGIKLNASALGTNDQNWLKWMPASSGFTALAIADLGARWAAGTVWIPRGFIVGTAANQTDNPTAAVAVVYGDFAAAPPAVPSARKNADGTTDGTWHVGDEAVNVNVSAGGVDRWRCITAGAFGAAVWKAVRLES